MVDEEIGERADAEDASGDEGKSVDDGVAAVSVRVQDAGDDGGDKRDKENNLKIWVKMR